jgi:carbonic anhydrase
MKKMIIGDVTFAEHNWILDHFEGDFLWLYVDHAAITSPYSCTLRNVISHLIRDTIVEIYVIGLNKRSKSITDEMLEEYYQKEQLSVDSIKTLEYMFIQTQDCTFADWIRGLPIPKDNIRESVHLLKHHPIIPERIKVTGYSVEEDEKKIIQII